MTPQINLITPQAFGPFSFSFASKILTVVGTVLAVALLGSGIGFLSLFNVSTETTLMVRNDMTNERLASDLHHLIDVNIALARALALSAEPQVGDALTPEIKETSENIDGLLEQLDSRLFVTEDRAILALIQEASSNFKKAYDSLTAARDSGLTSRIDQVVNERFMPASNSLKVSVVVLNTAQRAKINRAAERVSQSSQSARWGLVIFSICAMVLGCGLSFWLVRRISRPIQQALNVANRIASLDLSTSIEGHHRDEAGHLLIALERMQTSLKVIVLEVQGTSQNVAEGADTIAAGNQKYFYRTQDAFSFLQQTAASIEELSLTMHESIAAANTSEVMAYSAALNAANGSAVMSEVMQTMADINNSSLQIMEITSVIDSIAFQTNILALNAAVEAARAGDQGRGFAVVASEVRMLSNRSAAAAKEIKSLIRASAGTIVVGTEKATRAQGSMTEIVNAVERVNQTISQITAGNHLQDSRLQSINVAIVKLGKMTEKNASVVKELSASTDEQQRQASDLRDIAGRFQLCQQELALAVTNPK